MSKIIKFNLGTKVQKILFISSFFFLYLNTWSQFFPIPSGWIDVTGKEYLCNDCDSTFYSQNHFLVFKKGNYFHFKNIQTNKEFSDVNFQYLSAFDNGLAIAKFNNKFSIIDTNGNSKANFESHYAYAFSEGFARIQLGNRFTYINQKGERLLPIKYHAAYDFKNGFARVYLNGKWGFINTSGKEIIPRKYDFVWDFENGLACVMIKKDNKEFWGYIDTNGKEVIPLKYDYAFPFSEDFAIVRKGSYFNGKLYFINKSNEIVYEVEHKDIYSFKNEKACFYDEKNNKKWGYIDKNFNIVIESQFDQPAQFKNGLALVTKNNQKMYIDTAGSIVWKQ